MNKLNIGIYGIGCLGNKCVKHIQQTSSLPLNLYSQNIVCHDYDCLIVYSAFEEDFTNDIINISSNLLGTVFICIIASPPTSKSDKLNDYISVIQKYCSVIILSNLYSDCVPQSCKLVTNGLLKPLFQSSIFCNLDFIEFTNMFLQNKVSACFYKTMNLEYNFVDEFMECLGQLRFYATTQILITIIANEYQPLVFDVVCACLNMQLPEQVIYKVCMTIERNAIGIGLFLLSTEQH